MPPRFLSVGSSWLWVSLVCSITSWSAIIADGISVIADAVNIYFKFIANIDGYRYYEDTIKLENIQIVSGRFES